ncbi:MAG TPA: oligoendopeptidase F, partial [Anaerolineae bacterium]|nr:oligoendopeptidase F [Anaerolineae bacterium]
MSETTTLPRHSELPPQVTWNAPSVFPSREAWESEWQRVNTELPDRPRKYQGHLADSAALVLECLQVRDETLRRAQVLMVYADMSSSVDSNDQAAVAMASRARSLYGQVLAAFAFVEPELIAIGHIRLRGWANSEPRLVIYAHYFADLFRKQAHVRSGEVEELLGLLADPFSGVGQNESLLTNADFQFKPAQASTGEELIVSPSTYIGLTHSPDREVRRTAWESWTDEYMAHKNTLASNLVTSIKQNVFGMRARRHDSTLAAALFEDNIPAEVFHNLIAVFRQNLPTWQRYWAIKRKALGVDQLRYYDLWAPITTHPPTIPYEQAVALICAGLRPLGDEYVRTVRRGCLEDRWVDVYPNQGKVAGAFSTGAPGTHPFILTSYHDDVFSLSTLAHELGHSLHTYLTFENQPIVYCNYSLFVAEVASNFHQALVRAHLFKTQTDPQFQLALLEEAFANFLRYFFIMPTLARFELDVHQRLERSEGVTADTLMKLMADLFAEGFGGQLEIDHERQGIVWATFGHLYADYYVYQYATGISAANALAQRVLSNTPHAAEDYLRFLKAGNSVYSLDALKIAGVDLTKPEPVEAGFAVLAEMVDRLEKLIS